ncbi:rhombosortase [Vibrio fortis]|uniref:rhombosortase n=1 Tax=Vibrio fortis TaxID=212667 RepID=UPI0021C3A41D|nr:rhombosortase [Vibrio fortis]
MYPALVFISLICVLFQFDPIQTWVVWDQTAIANGQWWRIVTGNFSHTNLSHLAMNLAGLWVICFVFQPSRIRILAYLFLISVFTGAGLLLTDMQSYVGLSGTLHGLFGAFALTEALTGRRSSWLLVGGLVAKIAWEQLMGPSATTGALINARVAIEAHLIGAIGGLLLAWVKVKRRI